MSFREGRDRPRRGYPSRSEEKSNHARNKAPPSRHLWVGNLSHSLTERALSNHFREFGELESVAFQPGRSYAFINFIDEGAAFAAFEALQGFILAGNALRIEFTKADKSSASSRDKEYSRPRDEPRSSLRGSPFPQRARQITSHPIFHDHPKSNGKNNAEQPSEVLWVGFPQSLKVDEDSFWEAFSPFGEIEKVSYFPGRTYAFVRYKHINSSIRAKDNLEGKLFNNPRVHITFAKSDSGTSNSTRNMINDPLSPRGGRSYGSHDRYRETDRPRRSPRFMEPEGFDDGVGLDRKGNRLTGRHIPYEQTRFRELGPDIGNIYDGRNSPSRNRGDGFHDFPSRDLTIKRPLYDDEWDLPEDSLVYHGAKKLKTGTIPPEPELPEYPFFESEQVKHVLPRPPEYDNNLGHFGYSNHKQIPDVSPVNSHLAYVKRVNSGNQPFDTFLGGPGSVLLPQAPVEWKRSTPEPASDEWKWEGIIAKGGTSICRARCFPVGKVLDMILPELLDCTARTSLDMLSKHYYEAASSWVVFFVPESDADMGFYNEFMNYLGEKQRAAVAKLDDRTTLFLVPPSDFSEKILKVPGKLSISGVILRLESSSDPVEALPQPPLPQLQPDPYLVSSHGEASRTSFESPSGFYPPGPNFPNHEKPRVNSSLPGLPPGPVSFHVNRNMVEPVVENTQTHDHLFHQQGTHPQFGRNLALNETNSSNYRLGSPTAMPQYGHQEVKSSTFSVLPGIQPDQLAQLASYLGNTRQPNNTIVSDNVYRMPQTLNSPSLQIGAEHPTSQYHQVQPQQQGSNSNMIPVPPQSQSRGQEEADADPQKRLQATLQLAATLLKQIQQGKT